MLEDLWSHRSRRRGKVGTDAPSTQADLGGQGRRVLVTGHTGFKGSWLTLWLAALGADVVGIALPPAGDFDLFRRAGIGRACASRPVDLRDADAVRVIVRATRPEIVFHLAAQPLVRASYRSPVETWSTNVMERSICWTRCARSSVSRPWSS